MKHNKIKNTGILFNLFAKQIADDTLKNTDSKVIAIIKEHFKKGTELNKELTLYQALVDEKYKDENLSNKFIDVVLEERKKLNNTLLRKQKYNLIKVLKENFVIEDFFNRRVDDYKTLASIYKLFESTVSTDVVNPVEKLKSRTTLVEHISTPNPQEKPQELNEFSKQDKDLRLLSYKLLVDKFNEKYSVILNENQRTLLKNYILSVSNTNDLKEYVNVEIDNIKKDVKKYSINVNDKVIKIKLNEIINQMNEIKKDKQVKEEYLVRMMRYYTLIDELKNAKKTEK